jgi:hypothetical protein
MMRGSLFFLVIIGAISAEAAPLNRTVVLGRGERMVYQTATPIAIVSLQHSGSPSRRPIVAFAPQQYGRTITIAGVNEGEATLLVEDTAETLAEVVRVIVAPKSFRTLYDRTVEEWTASGGRAADVIAAPPVIVISGIVFSSRVVELCDRAQNVHPSIVCATRLAGVSSVVGDDCAKARANLDIVATPSTVETGDRRWTAVVRIADVPVLTLSGDDFARLSRLAAGSVRTLNRALDEWRRNAAARRQFPATFSTRQTGDEYEIDAQWTSRQGTRGEPLVRFRAGELPLAASSGGMARALAWEVTLLTDVFRLYTLARAPMRTGSEHDTALDLLYKNALKLGGSLTDWNCNSSLARSYVSLRWSTGIEPFETLSTSVPEGFR